MSSTPQGAARRRRENSFERARLAVPPVLLACVCALAACSAGGTDEGLDLSDWVLEEAAGADREPDPLPNAAIPSGRAHNDASVDAGRAERVDVYSFEARAPVGECVDLPVEMRPANLLSGGVDRLSDPHRVLVLGDSIVASRGDGARGGQFDVMRCLASDFERLSSIEMDLRAVPGQTIITQPPYSDSRGAVLATFVDDLFREGADIPETVIVTPSINELVVSLADTQTARVDAALDAIEDVVDTLRSAGVSTVFVLPMPPVSAQWAAVIGDAGRTARDIVALNTRGRERGIILETLDYGLDIDGDGLGEAVFYDDIPSESGADSFDGAHLDTDGQWMVGSTTFAALAEFV